MIASRGRDPLVCRVAPPHIVRAAIARAVIGEPESRQTHADSSATLGSLTLLPHQRDAVSRLRAMLRELHVALLADDVGLGKTYVALAIARDYQHVRVIAPAALLPMWRTALSRAQCTHAQLESLQRYSRMPSLVTPKRLGELVIVDEAHHLRTPATRRYRAIAESVSGCDLLLLSATPVHNTPGDLRALLALALGSQAHRLTDGLLVRTVVRRTELTGRPRVSERPPLTVPHDPALLEAILLLPAPLPAHEGAVAGALIRLGLLRAWCSSDAALTHSLRQRILRGEALRQALTAGRHPTTAELRSWLVGEHEVQLAFPELLAGHTPATGPLLDILAKHLDAVQRLLRHHLQESHGDAERASALKTIMQAHPDVPIVAFSQFSATVRAIARALSDIAGVGAFTGQRAWIASGPISRRDALACFAPVAQGRPPPPPHQRIRLLLSTDLLAEGVNLQDAGVVVHLDLPWTDALRRQRVGRCVRVGSPHQEVVVYRFEPPQGADAMLQLHARLERKALCSERWVGASSNRASQPVGVVRSAQEPADARAVARPRRSAADDATELRALLTNWLHDTERSADAPVGVGPLVCEIAATRSGFIAAVSLHDGASRLVSGRYSYDATGRARLRLSTSPRHLLPLVRITTSSGVAGRSKAHRWPRIHRALQRWIARKLMAANLGDAEPSASSVHRHVRTALSTALTGASPMQRSAARAAYQQTCAMLAQARGVAAEQALLAWVRGRDHVPLRDWLQQWRAWPTLAACLTASASATPLAHTADRASGRVAAVLILQPLTGCAHATCGPSTAPCD